MAGMTAATAGNCWLVRAPSRGLIDIFVSRSSGIFLGQNGFLPFVELRVPW
jgi:hypothetical protein